MSTHPCSDHFSSCDHCFACDVLGICCASLSAEQQARLEADVREQDSRLRDAIRLEAGTVPSLGELVRLDGALDFPTRQLSAFPSLPSSPLVLPPAAVEVPSTDSRKEALYVNPTRPV
jgi:hypothetical protein